MSKIILNDDGKAISYNSGAASVDNLVPENIKKGVSIMGVAGNLEGLDSDSFLQGNYSSAGAIIRNDTATSIRDRFSCDGSSYSPGFYYKEVYISNVTTIGNYGLYRQSKLTKVVCPKLTTIGMYAFWQCTSLTTIDLENVTTCSTAALGGCTALTTVSMPKLKSVPAELFTSNSGLTYVNLPEVTSTGQSSFRGTSYLRTLSLPKCKTLGVSFQYSGIRTIYLDSATSIAASCFDNCSSLTDLYLGSNTVCSIGGISQGASTSKPWTVHVPEDLIESYKAATNWKTMYDNGWVTFVAIE